jgi:integrase
MHIMKQRTGCSLSQATNRYIELKQALGRRFSHERRVLETVEDCMIRLGARDLTQSVFEHWSRTVAHLSPTVRRNQMRIVRNFCLYHRRTNPDCFVPDIDGFPRPHQPVQPYIYTDSDIIRLLRTASNLKPIPNSPLRPQVFRLAIVLLNTTGIRRGELAHLTIGDYDRNNCSLLVREGKFHKQRILPLSVDATRELETYLVARLQRQFPGDDDSLLLWNWYCHGYSGAGLGDGIRELVREAGIRTADGHLPRVHDMRHSFAIRVLIRWYKSGVDVQVKLPVLSTYMGHVSIASTEYYLPFVAELAGAAGDRFRERYGSLVRPIPDGGAA